MKRRWDEHDKWNENGGTPKKQNRPRCPEAPNFCLNPFEKLWSEQVLWWVAHKGGDPWISGNPPD